MHTSAYIQTKKADMRRLCVLRWVEGRKYFHKSRWVSGSGAMHACELLRVCTELLRVCTYTLYVSVQNTLNPMMDCRPIGSKIYFPLLSNVNRRNSQSNNEKWMLAIPNEWGSNATRQWCQSATLRNIQRIYLISCLQRSRRRGKEPCWWCPMKFPDPSAFYTLS